MARDMARGARGRSRPSARTSERRMRAWLSNLPSHGNIRGLLWMVVASLMFALFMLIARIGSEDLHVVQVAFMRYFMSLVLVLPVLARLGVAGFGGLIYGCTACVARPMAWPWWAGFTPSPDAHRRSQRHRLYRPGVHHHRRRAVFGRAGWRSPLGRGRGRLGGSADHHPTGVVPLNAGVLAMAAAVPLFAASDLFVKALVRTESPTVIIAVLNVILTVGMAPFAWWFWQPTDWRDWALAGHGGVRHVQPYLHG